MDFFGDPAIWLPFAFGALLGASILIYVVLDGFDLGVGVLFPFAEDDEKDIMIGSIGPFWDANETWLVLAIGILLVAFPTAHGEILTALYLPVTLMLMGLIMRGVAFEFRAKAPLKWKWLWNLAFYGGSLVTSLTQGYMLGMYIMGLVVTPFTLLFSAITAVFLTVAYSFIGATWLILKTSGALQRKAVEWAQGGIWGVVLGLGAVSLASPWVSPRIFEKWFSLPSILYLAPLPLLSAGLLFFVWSRLRRLPLPGDRGSEAPFVATIALFVLGFTGMAYSFYPYVVPEKLTIYESASAPESLFIILIGTCFVLPMILAYTAMAYFIFRGKATTLSYE